MGKVTIDRKLFLILKSGIGRKISIEERLGKKSGKLDLELGTSARVRDCLVVATDLSNPLGFWRRRRLEHVIIFFQVLENSRGRFALLSLEPFKGRRMRVFIPQGKKGSGWRLLAGEVFGLRRLSRPHI